MHGASGYDRIAGFVAENPLDLLEEVGLFCIFTLAASSLFKMRAAPISGAASTTIA